MKNIRVRFFAIFRENAGVETYQHQTRSETTMELFKEMTGIFPGLSIETAALVAINDTMAGWEQQLSDGDEVLFFPPVAGG